MGFTIPQYEVSTIFRPTHVGLLRHFVLDKCTGTVQLSHANLESTPTFSCSPKKKGTSTPFRALGPQQVLLLQWGKQLRHIYMILLLLALGNNYCCRLSYACFPNAVAKSVFFTPSNVGEEGLSTQDCSGPCAPGHYCPAGSVSAFQYACPAGRFGEAYGLTDGLCAEVHKYV